ncbi:YktB family protein [Enterococcus faecalis]|uniref:YktB family protein n=1 Tax=Enterococcus TaxID=1350 RepID=UPI001928B6F7|nr:MULTISPECIES: DUF1054 domain-containing protein [Enterococcus]EGO5181617.1 DUF1054 domain-containing protein [Enterococcus faecalis]EGO7934789.1 DUF1054 domain-containing protein [Enterococcus faecalis]EGO8124144.1 DUF1054 domain-containing protein [Enterococcus faecalis]EGO8779231.1 DUF1054 domain-containing protein [Enterococcus faecalis]EIA8320969.1 DUF1054 domain-containing protein [Enterococcus faecalis]
MLMFTEKEFAAFEVAGLDERMAVIRAQIQPIFQELDTYFAEQLAPELGTELFVHIAQHRRRTVYPPENTWSALSPNKRGYKMQPHFQLGIWGDYVFMWLSFIDNPKNEKQIAQAFLENQQLFQALPEDTYVSLNHTVPQITPLPDTDLEKALTRFRDVKKGEFEIGRIIPEDSALWQNPEKARAYMLATYQQLLPLYQLAVAQ